MLRPQQRRRGLSRELHRAPARFRSNRSGGSVVALINEITRLLSTAPDLSSFFKAVTDYLRRLIPFDRVIVSSHDATAGVISIVYESSRVIEYNGPYPRATPQGSVASHVIATRTGLLIRNATEQDVHHVPQLVPAIRAGMKSMMAAPIFLSGQPVGALHFQSMTPECYGQRDLRLAEVVATMLAGPVARSQFEHCLHEQAAQRAAVAQQAESERTRLALLEQRNRVSREMADSVMQELIGVIFLLSGLQDRLGSQAAEVDVASELADLRRMTRETLNEARRAVWSLHSEVLATTSLVDALKSELDRVARENGLQTSLEISGQQRVLPIGVEGTVLSVGVEAVASIARRSSATFASLGQDFNDSDVVLTVRDDGERFDPDASPEMAGLAAYSRISMRDRAVTVGGRLDIMHHPTGGSVLTLTVPTRIRG